MIPILLPLIQAGWLFVERDAETCGTSMLFLRQPHIYLSGSMDRTIEKCCWEKRVKGCPLLSQWLTFKLFWDYMFSRKAKVQNFYFMVYWLSKVRLCCFFVDAMRMVVC